MRQTKFADEDARRGIHEQQVSEIMGSNKTTDAVATAKKLSKQLLMSSSSITNSITNYSTTIATHQERWLKKEEKKLLKEERKLLKERDDLKRHAIDLAESNHAREPIFKHDRTILAATIDEVSDLRRSIQSKYVNRILGQLGKTQEKVNQEARSFEERSERMAKDFLDGNIRHEDFLERYINIRKNAIQKRILADKLVKERSKLVDGGVVTTSTSSSSSSSRSSNKSKNDKTADQQNSPTPTPRQKKRMSFQGKPSPASH